MMIYEYLKATPAYQRWSQNVPASQKDDWHSYWAYIARIDAAVCLMDILWPVFVQKGNLILREGALPDDWDKFMHQARQAHWSLSDIEYAINHVHIADLFLNDPDRDQIDRKVFKFLAEEIASMWRCRLNLLFPTEYFVVEARIEHEEVEVLAYKRREIDTT